MAAERSVVVVESNRSVVTGALLMVAVSLALFFLPLINGLVGVLVGGYAVGTVKRALLAAVLPAVVVGLGLWIIFAIFEAPVLGFFAGMAIGAFVLLSDVGLFLGAAIGGALSNRRLRSGTADRVTA